MFFSHANNKNYSQNKHPGAKVSALRHKMMTLCLIILFSELNSYLSNRPLLKHHNIQPQNREI